jgi:hypothetical protein
MATSQTFAQVSNTILKFPTVVYFYHLTVRAGQEFRRYVDDLSRMIHKSINAWFVFATQS